MAIEKRIKAFVKLGEYITSLPEDLKEIIAYAKAKNQWFTIENIERSLASIVKDFLAEDKLRAWLSNYNFKNDSKVIGIVAAGNIPLVAFHDVLCVLISGHQLKVKFSDKGSTLIPFLLNKLIEIESDFKGKIEIVERLNNFDAVIATGSNNSARYFEYYFGKYPNIIRKNRNSVAVLNGEESSKDLSLLGEDIFSYFGLGCRNVSKLWLPKEYNFQPFIQTISSYGNLMDHYHYKNNLDYNRTLLLMNQVPILDVDFVNLVEHEMIASPISNIHYEFYDSIKTVRKEIETKKEEIQCVVGNESSICNVGFGEAQSPSLMDYADNIDTMSFLEGL